MSGSGASVQPSRVLLVHGTVLFARFNSFRQTFKGSGIPRWIAPNSSFCTELRALCPNVKLQRMRWSGGNSPTCRREAALRLAGKIKRLATLYPDEQLFIVAHSHGGNVALEAIKHCNQSLVAGIACLGTPFFRFRARNVERAFFPITYLLAAGLCALCAVIAFLLAHFIDESFAFVSLLSIGLVLYFRESLKVSWIERLQIKLERIADENAHVFDLSLRLLCIESRRKEARWALKIARFLGSLPLTTARCIAMLWIGIQVLGAGIVAFSIVFIAPRDELLYTSWADMPARLGGGIVVLYFMYMLAIAVITPATWFMSRVMAWVSWGGVPPSMWIDTDVDFLPHDLMGDFEVRKIRSHRFLALEHCLLYEQSEIVGTIADWVQGKRMERISVEPRRQYFA